MRGTEEEKQLYHKLVNLPFQKSCANFEIIYKEALNVITKEGDLSYLSKYERIKEKWSRCFIIKTFTCGVCTTQRIESINSILSEKLNSQSPLQEVFQFIKSREFEVNKKIEDEISTYQNKRGSKTYENLNLFKSLKSQVSSYIIEKMKLQYEKSLNYAVEPQENHW